MKAVILAAGRGSRMGDLTKDAPKCFLTIEGVPLIEHQLHVLRKAGINSIAVVTGYMSELFTYENVTYIHNAQWAETNMLQSLLCAREWIGCDEVIICYSDILYPIDAISGLMKSEYTIATSYDKKWLTQWTARFVEPLKDAETFTIKANGELQTIGGRARTLSEIEGQYMGLVKLKTAAWRGIDRILSERDVRKMDMTSLFSLLLAYDYKIGLIIVNGNWFEFDSEQDIKAYFLIRDHYCTDLIKDLAN